MTGPVTALLLLPLPLPLELLSYFFNSGSMCSAK